MKETAQVPKRSAVVALLLLLLSSFDEPARFIDHLQKIHMHTPPTSLM
jgi:hypothetical protein